MSDDDGRIETEELPDGVLRITVSRPKKINSMTPEMWEGLIQAYERLEASPEVRVGLLCAEGSNFSGGLDLNRWRPLLTSGRAWLAPTDRVDPLGLGPVRRTKPVVVAVEGICFTIGIELVLAADIVVAARNARFAQVEVRRGVPAFGGATLRMAQSAGWGNAMLCLLTGDEFSAEDAYRFGFVQRLVEPGGSAAEALSIAERIATAAPRVVQATRENARTAVEQGFAVAREQLEGMVGRFVHSEEAAEAAAAFAEKREPRFTGR